MASTSTLPAGETMRVGALVFPGFQSLDLFGPLDALNMLAIDSPLTLSIISTSLAPVNTDPPRSVFPIPGIAGIPVSTNFRQTIIPTHTLETAPPLDLLIVPGGLGSQAIESTQPIVDFIKRIYPSLKYIMTICSGATLAARAGVLDEKRATTSKISFTRFTLTFPNVKWVSQARWVVDGKAWTSSGITAGLDITLAWIAEVYGKNAAEKLALIMEYKRITDSTFDEFAVSDQSLGEGSAGVGSACSR